MSEVELLQAILDGVQLVVNLLASIVAGVGFIAAGQFLQIFIQLKKERDF